MAEHTLEDCAARAAILERGCSVPIKTATGVWVRCGSRIKSRCESCAELYRGDWAAIARSGVFDGPVEQYRFYLLTLTAPSFGAGAQGSALGLSDALRLRCAPPCR